MTAHHKHCISILLIKKPPIQSWSRRFFHALTSPQLSRSCLTRMVCGISDSTISSIGCASLLLANGVPMKQIQEWLGYSDFSISANVYAHLDYNSKLSSADAMANGLKGALTAIQ